METGMAGIACPKAPISSDNPGKSMTRRDCHSRLLAAFPGQLTTTLRLELRVRRAFPFKISLLFWDRNGNMESHSARVHGNDGMKRRALTGSRHIPSNGHFSEPLRLEQTSSGS